MCSRITTLQTAELVLQRHKCEQTLLLLAILCTLLTRATERWLTKSFHESSVASSQVSLFIQSYRLLGTDLAQSATALASVAGILVVLGVSLPLSLIAVVPLASVYHGFMSYVFEHPPGIGALLTLTQVLSRHVTRAQEVCLFSPLIPDASFQFRSSSG